MSNTNIDKTRTVRLGVVGVGSMGQHHARVIASLSGAQLVGVADYDFEKASQIATAFGVRAFRDYRELLSEVEGVSVAVTTENHYEIGMECFRRGVHVLMEKPLAATVEQARQLVAASTESGNVLLVGHVERFNPTYREMTKALEGKKILALEARRLSPYAHRTRDISVIFDLMVHDLDLIMDLIKAPVASVRAVGLRAKSPGLDHVIAQIVFSNGIIAGLTASKITQQKVRQLVSTCTDALVEADLLARTVLVHRQAVSGYRTELDKVSYRQEGFVEQVYVPLVEPLFTEISHFRDCVRSGCAPMVGGAAAVEVLKLAESIEKAAASAVCHLAGSDSQPAQCQEENH